MATHEVAIYAPCASSLYERSPRSTGGAEVQATVLARAMAERGLRIAHIVYAVRDPVPPLGVALIARAPQRGHKRLIGKIIEAGAVWRAMARADADTYVFRTGSVELAFAALFCRLRRRNLVFSTSAVADLTFEELSSGRRNLMLYRFGAHAADVVVVQTNEQLPMAHSAFPRAGWIERIPSFTEPVRYSSFPSDYFLWIGRLDGYKLPLEFVQLAQAVPESRFKMVGVAGKGCDGSLRKSVFEAAEPLENLELLPPLPRGEVLDLIDRAIAVVSTSRSEGLPNVFLEAWARRVPVLSLGVDPDRVIERKGLGIVAGGSPQALARGARALSTDRALREHMGDAARRHVCGEHGTEAVGAQWHRLLMTLAR